MVGPQKAAMVMWFGLDFINSRGILGDLEGKHNMEHLRKMKLEALSRTQGRCHKRPTLLGPIAKIQ